MMYFFFPPFRSIHFTNSGLVWIWNAVQVSPSPYGNSAIFTFHLLQEEKVSRKENKNNHWSSSVYWNALSLISHLVYIAVSTKFLGVKMTTIVNFILHKIQIKVLKLIKPIPGANIQRWDQAFLCLIVLSCAKVTLSSKARDIVLWTRGHQGHWRSGTGYKGQTNPALSLSSAMFWSCDQAQELHL